MILTLDALHDGSATASAVPFLLVISERHDGVHLRRPISRPQAREKRDDERQDGDAQICARVCCGDPVQMRRQYARQRKGTEKPCADASERQYDSLTKDQFENFTTLCPERYPHAYFVRALCHGAEDPFGYSLSQSIDDR